MGRHQGKNVLKTIMYDFFVINYLSSQLQFNCKGISMSKKDRSRYLVEFILQNFWMETLQIFSKRSAALSTFKPHPLSCILRLYLLHKIYAVALHV